MKVVYFKIKVFVSCHGPVTFIFMHLADAFIQSDLHCIQAIFYMFIHVFLSVCVFPVTLRHFFFIEQYHFTNSIICV